MMLNRSLSRYQILERLSASRMGEVYKARDLKLDRFVALKLLLPEGLFEASSQQGLLMEARAAAALNHRNIAIIHELEQTEELTYIVMEYIEGETLKQRMARGRLEIGAALDIAMQVADALTATHERGIIHCDIKSSNIMITKESYVKVLDFGLAKLVRGMPAQAEDGTISGTPAYLSPEQARGEPPDARSDIFSLGVVIYEMVTGRLPFVGEGRMALLGSLLNDEPLPIGASRHDVPLELESIVRRALEKGCHERYQTAQELLSDLKRLKDGLAAIAAYPETIDPLPHPAESITDQPSPWQRLSSILKGKTAKPAYPLPRGAAFRGLLPFQEADRDRFYGREIETAALFEMITHGEFRFGVLYGESGCGKTSLLRAALMPRLWQQGYAPVYCRSYRDPLTALLEACRQESGIELREDEAAIDYIRRVAEELNTGIVIICDQFEEFFTNFKTEQEREPFVSFATACYHAAHLPVRLLFSMRSDFLYLINSEFSGRVPNPLISSRLYHLRNLDEKQAEEIIESSVLRANLQLEAGLSRQLVHDLANGDSILPSELQIVGAQLQNHRIFSVQEYRRAGGKAALVYSFLEDVLQASGDRECAQLLLRSLISDENTRLTLPLDELVSHTQRSRQRVAQILNLFVQSRLIREIQEDEPWSYELIHEYLIDKINQITGQVMDATQRANRLFRQYISSYSVDQRTRIPLSQLWSINRYADLKRGERERELLKKSLIWGLVKATTLAVLLAVGTTLAVSLSMSEKWDSVKLSDGHAAAVRRVAFSPDGRFLVSVGDDNKVIVWDFVRRKPLATFDDHTDAVTTVAFSPNGEWIATGSEDSTIIIWDAAQLKRVAVLRGQRGRVGGLAFSPDGELLLSRSQDQPGTFVWDTLRWEKVRELPSVSTNNYFLFSPDRRSIINPSGKTWSLATGEETTDAFEPINEGFYDAALDPHSMRLVGIDPNGRVSFLDMEKRKALNNYTAHRDNGRAAVFSPDGRLAATGAEKIILWDAITQTALERLEHNAIVWGLAFSPDGRWLVSGHGDGAILLWDVAGRELVANFNEHGGSVQSVAFSPDGKMIASAGYDQSVIIWDAQSGRKQAVLVGHTARIVALAFSPDNRSLATTDFEGTLIYWDVAAQSMRWELKKSEHPLLPAGRCLAISPDGRWIVTTIRIYDSSNGRQVAQLPYHVYGMAFSPDGRRLLGTYGEQLFYWDTEQWKMIHAHTLTDMTILKVNFSPDGKWLVSGDTDGAVRLWSAQPLREVALLGRHRANVRSVIFSPDGTQVVSASDDQTIALWDVKAQRLIARIGSPTAPVSSVAFSPDGKRLISGEHDRSVRVHTRHRTLWGYQLD